MKTLLIMEKEYIYQEPSHSRGRTWLSNSKEAFEYNTWSDMQSKSREAHSITSNSVLCICYTHGHLLFCFSSNLSTSPHELIVSQSLSDFLGKWEASHCETKSVREGGPSQTNKMYERVQMHKGISEWMRRESFCLGTFEEHEQTWESEMFWITFWPYHISSYPPRCLPYNPLNLQSPPWEQRSWCTSVHEKWKKHKTCQK